jgi:hypothetical protein
MSGGGVVGRKSRTHHVNPEGAKDQRMMSLRTRSLHPILDHLEPLTGGPATAYEDSTLCLNVIPAQALSNVGRASQLCFLVYNACLFRIRPRFPYSDGFLGLQEEARE